ncbi:hypothetical protein SIN8267_02123 [Sinobacterium norvegicum]|uniref:Formyl transferase N-terminal domain-containing protein n=1 Tax=Sinobacterium norvegicum TaxID=1641715 RepID=A0ABM9AG61_9GAMM|nr:hypothetical protein [Sinobacterium norvegicum]CAH0992008.1 hypothetical protein SIN8267_02123 [Sinobacterium norvegicum]
MDILNVVDDIIDQLSLTLSEPSNASDGLSSCQMLYQLASHKVWGVDETNILAFLSKRLDISGKFFLSYRSNGRKSTDLLLTDRDWLSLAQAIFVKAVLKVKECSLPALHLKQFNTLFKAMDLQPSPWLTEPVSDAIEQSWSALQAELKSEFSQVNITYYDHHNPTTSKTCLPLTVLFYEGPIARAYLETLASLNLKPEKIIQLVPRNDIATKKPIGRWLPKSLRIAYSANIQSSKIHFWPKKLKKSYSALTHPMTTEIERKLSFSASAIESANALLPLSHYSDNIEPILIENLADQALHQHLTNEAKGAILFTGGGIMPSTLLSLSHLKFLHIHPGFLPDIRGADCALWSTLSAGYFSASCFYMAPGIDTGDIITPCWLPKIDLSAVPRDTEMLDGYRAIYSFIDPWVRSYVLRDVLINASVGLDELSCIKQDEEEGTTFHFMHDRLKQAALNKIFI